MAYIAFFSISQGATVWVYISEVFPTNVPRKGQSLGSSSHWITNALITIVFPVMAKRSASIPFVFFAAMMLLDFFLGTFHLSRDERALTETLQHQLDADSLV